MKPYTLHFTFNGKKYKSTVTATDRLHAMNLIRNKIEFLPEPKKDNFMEEFFDVVSGKTNLKY
jgi:hypothetical protein